MRLLVTGGSGYLGTRLCASLARMHDVFALFRTDHPRIDGLTWIPHDYRRGPDFKIFPSALDGIVHLAQSADYRDFPTGADDMFGVNVEFTYRLLEFSRKNSIGTFIFASTGGMYEQSVRAISESDITTPSEFYPATKLAAEVLINPYIQLLRACILRLFFVYGPGQSGRLIPMLAERISVGRPVTLPGTGDGLLLTPTHVDDVVAVIEAALTHSWIGTFNVAAPEVLSIREIADMLGAALGRPVIFERTRGQEPKGLIPNLDALSSRYEMRSFRKFIHGAHDVVAAVER